MVESRSAPLFGLAPGDACRAVCVATNAVGSYPTVSPLPDPAIKATFGGRPSAVCSLLRLCRIAPPGRYPAPCPWSPDFPPALRPAIIQPSLSRRVSITIACRAGKRIHLREGGRIDPSECVCYSPFRRCIPVPTGCSKRSSSKAAASERTRRTASRYVAGRK